MDMALILHLFKKRLARSLAALALLAAVAALAAACGPDKAATPAADGKLAVVATIYPMTYFTQRVGGDRIRLTSLVPAGVEAHDYEPKPSDLQAINRAKVVVYNHPAFETWMADALKSVGAGKTVVQAANIPVPEGTPKPEPAEGENYESIAGKDPTVWLNPLEAMDIVRRIADGLIAADPSGSQVYNANAAAVISDLTALHERYSAGLKNCSLNTIVVSHEAFGHMAALYGFRQLGLAGLTPEAESSPAQVAGIVRKMKELGVKYILVEPIISQKLAETVAAETGAGLLPLHPLESLTQGEIAAGDDYLKIMDRNLQSLRTALNCGS